MAPRKRAAAGPASSSNNAEAGPSTRAGASGKRVKVEPSLLPDASVHTVASAAPEMAAPETTSHAVSRPAANQNDDQAVNQTWSSGT